MAKYTETFKTEIKNNTIEMNGFVVPEVEFYTMTSCRWRNLKITLVSIKIDFDLICGEIWSYLSYLLVEDTQNKKYYHIKILVDNDKDKTVHIQEIDPYFLTSYDLAFIKDFFGFLETWMKKIFVEFVLFIGITSGEV